MNIINFAARFAHVISFPDYQKIASSAPGVVMVDGMPHGLGQYL